MNISTMTHGEAGFPGTCSGCMKRFAAGEQIARSRATGAVYHAGCAEKAAADEAARAAIVAAHNAVTPEVAALVAEQAAVDAAIRRNSGSDRDAAALAELCRQSQALGGRIYAARRAARR